MPLCRWVRTSSYPRPSSSSRRSAIATRRLLPRLIPRSRTTYVGTLRRRSRRPRRSGAGAAPRPWTGPGRRGRPGRRSSAAAAPGRRPRGCGPRAAPALRAPPTETVATGTPAGICTIDSSESMPSRCSSGTGTPITGSGVTLASMPGRCAAPPAPATMTFRPRPAACSPYAIISRGIRCAETTSASYGTSNSASAFAASCITGQSLVAAHHDADQRRVLATHGCLLAGRRRRAGHALARRQHRCREP